MPKYKNLDEGLIDKFIDKLFGGVAKSQAKSHIKKITKKDPKLGKRLARAQQMAVDTRKYLKSLPKDEYDDFMKQWDAL
jgi:hypothetical protein|tara:strand:- start:671 stop:907 length:237 start_codon:yes stop_codon:yes gene_type:complete